MKYKIPKEIIKEYDINEVLFKKVMDKGYCLCDLVKFEDDSNVCPCKSFLETKLCKCTVFTKKK